MGLCDSDLSYVRISSGLVRIGCEGVFPVGGEKDRSGAAWYRIYLA